MIARATAQHFPWKAFILSNIGVAATTAFATHQIWLERAHQEALERDRQQVAKTNLDASRMRDWIRTHHNNINVYYTGVEYTDFLAGLWRNNGACGGYHNEVEITISDKVEWTTVAFPSKKN